MKALVGAFNQEKALVGAFSVIVQPVVEPMADGSFYSNITDAAAGASVGLRDPGRGESVPAALLPHRGRPVRGHGRQHGGQPRLVTHRCIYWHYQNTDIVTLFQVAFC